MPNPLTNQDVEVLGSLLHDHADRTAFYLHYYELSGNEQVAAMAKISNLTDFEGAVAAHANEAIESKFPDQYPPGGVFEFSKEIPVHLFNAIVADVNAGGSGILSERQALEAAREAWDARGLGDQFPGNALLVGQRALDGDIKAAWDALDSDGTVSAINGAVYSLTPDISGAPAEGSIAPYIDHPEKYSYHLTENEKLGFFVDRETGITAAVFDRPAEREPMVESKGVLNTLLPESIAPQVAFPDPTPALNGGSYGDAGLDLKPHEDRASLGELLGTAAFVAGLTRELQDSNDVQSAMPVANDLQDIEHSSASNDLASTLSASKSDMVPNAIDAPIQSSAPTAEQQIQLPAELQSTDFGTGQKDYRADFTQFLADPPEGASATTLIGVSLMNSQLVANNVPMTYEHYEAATASLARGDSLLSFMEAERPHVLESTGSGLAYELGYGAHALLGQMSSDRQDSAPDVGEAPVPESQFSNGHLFSDKPLDPWSDVAPFTLGAPSDGTTYGGRVDEPSLPSSVEMNQQPSDPFEGQHFGGPASGTYVVDSSPSIEDQSMSAGSAPLEAIHHGFLDDFASGLLGGGSSDSGSTGSSGMTSFSSGSDSGPSYSSFGGSSSYSDSGPSDSGSSDSGSSGSFDGGSQGGGSSSD